MNLAPKIFISYRRNDSAHCMLLWEHMLRWFGEENVFFDRDRNCIKPTSEFPLALASALQAAEIFLALIGQQVKPKELWPWMGDYQ